MSWPKTWTMGEEIWLKEHYPNIGTKACALALGKSRGAIRSKARRMGLKINNEVAKQLLREAKYLQFHKTDKKVKPLLPKPWKAKPLSQKTKDKISKKTKERFKDKKQREYFRKMAKDQWNKIYNKTKILGKNHHNWKNAKTPLMIQIRSSKEYKEWRDKVFKRDNYTCWLCGKKGGNLVAHHIRDFSKYPQERFNVTNGITLCEECHRIIHSKSYDFMIDTLESKLRMPELMGV